MKYLSKIVIIQALLLYHNNFGALVNSITIKSTLNPSQSTVDTKSLHQAGKYIGSNGKSVNLNKKNGQYKITLKSN